MARHIDPLVDCVFKAILGTERNKNLLTHFLNAVLSPPDNQRIVEVTLLNPFNEKEFLDDKLSIVDIKAVDEAGRVFQIEVQLRTFPALPLRMLYTWADLVAQQLEEGCDYAELPSVISIWVGLRAPFATSGAYLQRFEMREAISGVGLVHDSGIIVLNLSEWRHGSIDDDLGRWLFLLKEGGRIDLDNPPSPLQTIEMRQAVETMKTFTEKQRAYDAYRRRQEFLRENLTIENELKALRVAQERLQQELAHEAALRQAEAALRQAAEAREAAVREAAEAREAALLRRLAEFGVHPPPASDEG